MLLRANILNGWGGSYASDALVKLKLAFKSGTVDLDRGDIKAANSAITLADDPNNLDYLGLNEDFHVYVLSMMVIVQLLILCSSVPIELLIE